MALFDLAPTLLAAELGAKSIYHRVLTVTNAFVEWRHDNPAISHLMDEATALATDALEAHGVPVEQIEAMGTMLPKIVAASLAGIGAADATVPSLTPGAAPYVAPAPAPPPVSVAPAPAPVPEPAPVPLPAPEPPAAVVTEQPAAQPVTL